MCYLYLLAVPALALVMGIGWVLEGRDRWGVWRAPVAAGQGAYRAASVTRETARRVPPSVVIAGLLAPVWGAITMLVLMPAGAVLALMLLGSGELPFVFAGMIVAAAAVSGIALACMLFRVGSALAQRAPDAPITARETAIYGACHHALIWVLFPLPLLAGGPPDLAWRDATLALAVPCGVGLVVALVVLVAGRRVAALDAEDHARISTSSPIEISIDS
ncbi:hypothetical protein [Sandaracinus amylolyticus]|uniref:hypothetical protein n=1 Tax=Sandaracinus amylolyticus TaxID=927083 RepID=UPI001F473C55|nr:hypothetical protein [Sandaracinus amylolyticus]UJR86943.1 Hypothetical protein I5071_90440 [Sandaracinus amylolyticus]